MVIKKCQNKCIFCFIDQLPKDLRKTLYLKDDDYLESFKYGNFITLTNLTDKDINKIIKYRLSPLYISFHSADIKIRNFIFNNKNNYTAISTLKKLDKAMIETHIQIVVCPEINDGEDLLNTLDFLKNLNNIQSIGLVPVGITKYNKNDCLKSFNKPGSDKLINMIDDKKKDYTHDVYLSDEFYVLAGRELPPFKEYKNFPQIENGIGLITDFLNDFNQFLDNYMALSINNKHETFLKKSIYILILTSEYFLNYMHSLLKKFNEKIKSLNMNFTLKLDVEAVKNYIFEGNVKVMGLLTYNDIYKHFNNKKAQKNYDKILISDIIFNKDKKTLDDKKIDDFKKISKKIIFIENKGKSLAKELLKK